jgi:hypothetical protein
MPNDVVQSSGQLIYGDVGKSCWNLDKESMRVSPFSLSPTAVSTSLTCPFSSHSRTRLSFHPGHFVLGVSSVRLGSLQLIGRLLIYDSGDRLSYNSASISRRIKRETVISWSYSNSVLQSALNVIQADLEATHLKAALLLPITNDRH